MSGFLYKNLKNSEQLIKSREFPKVFSNNCGKYTALIGVGGNIGDVKRRFFKLINFLNSQKRVKILATSIIYKNPPFGYLKQDYFYNTVFLISTNLQPMELLLFLQRTEKRFKRKRLFKDAPRTLDLDIIMYEKRKINKFSALIVPHPKWKERASVTLPLKFLKGAKCLKRVL